MKKSNIRRLTQLLLLVVVLPTTLGAATVYSSITPVTATNGSPVSINLNASLGPVTDSIIDFTMSVQDIGANSSLSVAGQAPAVIAKVGSFGQQLNPGDSVGPTLSFAPGNTVLAIDNFGVVSLGPWAGGATAYVGVQFQIAANTHYGFARVTWNPDNALTLTSFATIDQVGYNTVPGQSAVIPPLIPEPSSMMLLSLLGFSTLIRRQR